MTEHLPVLEYGEIPPAITIKKPPAIDLFLAGVNDDSLLSPAIVENPLLLDEAKERRRLYNSLGQIFEAVSDGTVSMRKALKTSHINETELTRLYDQLSSFLREPSHYRLILYLPFQLLPENSHNPERNSLSLSEKRFTDIYLEAWKHLYAGENDVRTNYTDGDILEPELKRGQTPVVRKAAHLLPELVRRNLVDIAIIQYVLKRSNDPVLIRSTLETFPILIEQGYLQKDSLNKLASSQNELLGKTAQEIKKRYVDAQKQVTADQKIMSLDAKGLPAFFKSLGQSVRSLEKNFFVDHKYPPGTPLGRLDWDKQLAVRTYLNQHATVISRNLASGHLRYDSISPFILNPEDPTINRLVSVTGTLDAIEHLTKIGRNRALSLTEQFLADLSRLGPSQPDSVREAIETGLYHLKTLDLIPDNAFPGHNISIPSFDSILPTGVKNQGTSEDLSRLAETIGELKHDDEWMKYLYPVILVNGSRIKGYARTDADLDSCVFIRPSVSWEERPTVLKVVNEKLNHLEKVGKVVEFWLEDSKDGTTIKNVPFEAPTVARPDWGYVLLGSVWIGDKSDSKNLSNELISWYLKGGHIPANPSRYSRHESQNQIERDSILYRLGQKGWSRFYPQYQYVAPELSPLIDADCAFWDPLFRRTASRLFVQKVFYPDISG